MPGRLPSVALGCLVLCAGCAHRGALAPAQADGALTYSFEQTTSIRTFLVEPDGTELGQLSGPDLLAWTGRIEQRPERRFRDGSQGDRVRFLEVSVTATGGPPGPSELSGLSVELRGFENREILALGMLDHLIGDPRWGDLWLALWPALSPEIPDLQPGQTVRQRSNLPFMLESGMGAPIALDLSWSLEGTVPCEAGTCWKFACAGPVVGRGLERHELWLARYRLSGQAQGAVWLATLDNALVQSDLDLEIELTTTLSDPATQVPRGVIRQQQLQSASVHSLRSTP